MTIRNLLLGLLSTCAVGALAEGALADPSARVGRVGFIEGEVSFVPPGETFWTPAARNFPVAPGESFWTDERGRAELQIGAVTVRLDNETEMDVLNLDYGAMRLSLPQGSMDVRIWDLPRGGVLISTPAGPVRLERAGVYRIDVAAPGDDGLYPPVEVTVLEGAARTGGRGGYTDVQSGEAGLIYAGYDADLVEAYDASIDDWARRREATQRRARHAEFTSAMTGVDDLDGYGEFAATADYGTVWYPRDVPADWAPYRYGHWAYVQPWGYTWIDDQSWGFAPFHYGRWVQIQNRWAWAPGRSAPEPVYAPALVAFVGGSSWNIAIGGGSGAAVGWVPLAPDEVYRPTYRVSDAYVRQINVTNVKQTTINNITVNNVTNVTNITQYRNAPAATVVRAQAFSQGASVQRAAVAVSAAVIARAPMQTEATRPPPAPQAKAAIASGPAGAAAAAPPHAAAPPARLQAVRSAVAAQPATATAPPAITGAHIAPDKPLVAAGQKPPLIAPAQVKAPQAQGREVVPNAHVPTSPGKPVAAGPIGPGSGAPPVRPAPLPDPRSPRPPASSDARPQPTRAAPAVDVRPKPEATAPKPASEPTQAPSRAPPPPSPEAVPARAEAAAEAAHTKASAAEAARAATEKAQAEKAAQERAKAQAAAEAAQAKAGAAQALAAQNAAAEKAQAEKAAEERAKAEAAAEAAQAKAGAAQAVAAQKAAAEKAQAEKAAQERAKAVAAAEAAKKRNPDADKAREPALDSPR